MQHIREQATGTISRIEFHAAKPIRCSDLLAERFGLNFQYPKICRLGMAELIGLVAAFDNEAAWIAVYVFATLRKIDFRVGRNSDQKMFFAFGKKMPRCTFVAERPRCQA